MLETTKNYEALKEAIIAAKNEIVAKQMVNDFLEFQKAQLNDDQINYDFWDRLIGLKLEHYSKFGTYFSGPDDLNSVIKKLFDAFDKQLWVIKDLDISLTDVYNQAKSGIVKLGNEIYQVGKNIPTKSSSSPIGIIIGLSLGALLIYAIKK